MISAIVLAAGQSMRMGQPKMLLPWGQTTVIGRVIATLIDAGLKDLNVITGENQKELKEALSRYQLNFVFNPNAARGDMLLSFQIGLRYIRDKSEAALLVLGDQPQIESNVVHSIIEHYYSTGTKIIIPSFRMHRGHPWLIDKSLWNEILELKPGRTLRDYLNQNQDNINYINVMTPSIIQDLDTSDDYQSYKP
jgi:molybdenum cofactor cytidylyltransferase